MFTGDLLKPAPKPTTFIFGRRTVYDPSGMDYAGSYMKMFDGGDDMMPTVYRYGARLKLDVTRETDSIIGKGTVRSDGVVTIKADQPVFLVDLER